jgi:hypothetical protein
LLGRGEFLLFSGSNGSGMGILKEEDEDRPGGWGRGLNPDLLEVVDAERPVPVLATDGREDTETEFEGLRAGVEVE